MCCQSLSGWHLSRSAKSEGEGHKGHQCQGRPEIAKGTSWTSDASVTQIHMGLGCCGDSQSTTLPLQALVFSRLPVCRVARVLGFGYIQCSACMPDLSTGGCEPPLCLLGLELRTYLKICNICNKKLTQNFNITQSY